MDGLVWGYRVRMMEEKGEIHGREKKKKTSEQSMMS